MSRDPVVVYTDGSCKSSTGRRGLSNSSGPGGWAFLLQHDYPGVVSGGVPATTASKMELLAVTHALNVLDEGQRIVVRTDYMMLPLGLRKIGNRDHWSAAVRIPKPCDAWLTLLDAIDRHASVTVEYLSAAARQRVEHNRAHVLVHRAAKARAGELKAVLCRRPPKVPA